jgi:hypothetical protein
MNYEYNLYTTVDITPTGVNANSKSNNNLDYNLRRNQQRNCDTLCQVISLRANLHKTKVISYQIYNAPTAHTHQKLFFPDPNLPDYITVWKLQFYCDRQMTFGESHEALYNDLHMVPIVPALSETVPQYPPYFLSYGQLKNIFIE